MGKKLLGLFRKRVKKANQKEFRTEKLIKKNMINFIWNRKVMIIPLIVGSIEKYCFIKLSYFPEPFTSKNKIKIVLSLSNYATKFNLKNATGVFTLQFAKRDDLANLKTEADKLDIDELKTTPVDFKKLSDVADEKVVKKDVYNTDKQVVDIKIYWDDIKNIMFDVFCLMYAELFHCQMAAELVKT